MTGKVGNGLMETRNIAKLREEISLLGFGCMRLPRRYPDKQDIDEEQAQALIDYAIAQGVNYFDTAYPYHEGLSEPFVGRALKKYRRESFRLATKMPPWSLKVQADTERVWAEQKRSCQVDYFDFYLLHNMDRENAKTFEEFQVYEFLRRKKEAGEIRHLGFSFHEKPDFLAELIKRYDWDFAQIQLNYQDWELQDAKGQYELLTKNEIPVIVMEPVRGGVLANLTGESLALLRAHSPNRSAASWAIRFAASLPNVMTVLSGMSNMEQVMDNVATMNAFAPLSDRERAVLGEALDAYRRAEHIPCTGCRYCMDCPEGVDIPQVFAAFNQYRSGGDSAVFKRAYAALSKEKQAHHCVGCGKCVPLCPQSIKIPAVLKKIAQAAQ